MKRDLVSIIVPVYNVENYIEKCIESIVSQSYNNLEIILVDDGSKDASGKICDQFSIVDKRIKVIHKNNGGLSDARNCALDVMKGEYVSFIDSDDYVSPFYVENLINAISNQNADMSISWFKKVFKNEKTKLEESNIINSSLKICDSYECMKKLLYQDGVETSAWGKLYKKTIFDGVRFPKGKLYEDIPVTVELIRKADKIAIISNVDYYYYQRESSIQNRKFDLKKMDLVIHMEEMMKFVKKNFPSLEEAAICRYFCAISNLIFQINDDDFYEEKTKLWNEIKKYRHVILHDKNAHKKAKLAAFLSYGGYKIMSFFYVLLKKKG